MIKSREWDGQSLKHAVGHQNAYTVLDAWKTTGQIEFDLLEIGCVDAEWIMWSKACTEEK